MTFSVVGQYETGDEKVARAAIELERVPNV